MFPLVLRGDDSSQDFGMNHSRIYPTSPLIFPVFTGLIDIWHENRIYIVLASFSLYCVARAYSIWRSPNSKSTHPPHTTNLDNVTDTIERHSLLDCDLHIGTEKSKLDLSRAPASATTKSGEVAQKAEIRMQQVPRRVTGMRVGKRAKSETSAALRIQPLVFFSSWTGTTEKYARSLCDQMRQTLRNDSPEMVQPDIYDLSYIDYDDFFVHPPKAQDIAENVQYFYLIILPSYNIDTALDNFLSHLQETHHDFRIETAPLSGLVGYSVFGFGDREGWAAEEEGFCSQAIEVDKWMAKLTAKKRAYPIGLGDVKSDAVEKLEGWRDGVIKTLLDVLTHDGLGEGVMGSGDAIESDEDEIDELGDDIRPGLPKSANQNGVVRAQNVDDLEDLGGKARTQSLDVNELMPLSSPLLIDFTSASSSSSSSSPAAPRTIQSPKAMVPKSSPTYAALTKQGYTIIGSHSGVKICRWTKSALRGRGSCYKFSFYGIKSHLCMETTPSLSCSNKCIFCWRHGTNPVGTTWRWKIDPPDMIFRGAKEGHYHKIKMMRGVPGVRAERFQEAMNIRHCALSLVGEPIFYPHINEFLALLHKERISSFLVCNAQHPDQLAALKSVTQLYVSIDASNAESLRKIDRPLHRDYWQRFLRCLDILYQKRLTMRTVYRLTLVKGFNIEEEVEGYANLVGRGLPCFVEIKGVTYCGTSSSAGAGLTMQNVPFYEEITAFVEALNAALKRKRLDYGIAAEHAHSCCVLIASKRFYVDGEWHTLIDYEKYFECLESGKVFSPEDYMGPTTPEWATWGNGGFDPADVRVDRKGKPKGITASATRNCDKADA